MPSKWTNTAVTAVSTVTSTAATFTSIGFGIAKATTKFCFSIARSVTSIAPIPLLDASLTHLENLSLLPILLGETIASTSLTAVSTSLDLISTLLDTDNEASFSLAAFVSLMRREWAEHGSPGHSVTAVARAVVAWAAVQSFTKEWSEDQWLKSVRELKSEDFRSPELRERTQTRCDRHRTMSRVSVTEDVIMFGRSGQVVSADIGEKECGPVNDESTPVQPRGSPPGNRRSNYETRRTLRRLSKMVLAGYGGAGLLFFGVPLHPNNPLSSSSSTDPKGFTQGPQRTDTEVKDSEEGILVQAVEDAEAEAMSPSKSDLTVPEKKFVDNQKLSSRPLVIPGLNQPYQTARASAYSWWNVLLGKHDREIFEGFAFTAVDDNDQGLLCPPYNRSPSVTSYMSHRTFRSFPTSNSSYLDTPTINRDDERPIERKIPQAPTAIIGDSSKMPRFWVLTDHARRQVVLVVRGTFSYYDLTVDLQCEPETFKPATASLGSTFIPTAEKNDLLRKRDRAVQAPENQKKNEACIPFPTMEDDRNNMPGDFGVRETQPQTNDKSHFSARGAYPRRSSSLFDVAVEPSRSWHLEMEEAEDDEDGASKHQVHGGMLQLARAMGSQGKPVQEAVCAALARNRGYELVLCGHSLGAGVASLLALMWADPSTCRTVPSSGLPSNRHVSVYAFGPPCITSGVLSRLCQNMITSIVNSFDVVSRLSLGSFRDLNRAAYWLCEAEGEESTMSVLRRTLKDKINFVGGAAIETKEEKQWFIALRKTLEANMCFAHLFPPGKIWWAVHDEALHPSHQRGEDVANGVRLYEVLHVEHVFRQIEFKGDMLSAHLPHQYDRMLAELD